MSRKSLGQMSVDMVSKDTSEFCLNERRFVVSQEENSGGGLVFDGYLFVRNLGIWFVSFFISIAMVVIFDFIGTNSFSTFWEGVLVDNEVLNVMFSLVLTVLLEQIWNYSRNGVNVNMMREFLIGLDFIFVIVGMLLYLSFIFLGNQSSDGSDGKNLLSMHRNFIEIVYYTGVIITVILNLLSRSLISHEEKGGVIK